MTPGHLDHVVHACTREKGYKPAVHDLQATAQRVRVGRGSKKYVPLTQLFIEDLKRVLIQQ